MSKVDEIITRSEQFALEFIRNINDQQKEPAAKTVYFMDNQEDLQKVMNALQKIVNQYGPDEDGNQREIDEDEEVLFNRAKDIIDKLSDCISNYKNALMVNENVTEEDTTAKVTSETINDAMQNNDTTKKIAKDMNDIASNKQCSGNCKCNTPKNVQMPGMNFALVCDGQLNMFQANNKQEINSCIQEVLDSGSYQDVALFQVSYKHVPLKTKTVLSV